MMKIKETPQAGSCEAALPEEQRISLHAVLLSGRRGMNEPPFAQVALMHMPTVAVPPLICQPNRGNN
jgi:hypothetical protein